MLIAEKFLREHVEIIDFPMPYSEGICGYEFTENKVKTINFIYFSTINYKNNFQKYNFRFETLSCDFAIKQNNMSSKLIEVEYNFFYKTFYEIKDRLLKSNNYYVMKSIDDIKINYWKAFVICNDSWFANHMNELPTCFMLSLDYSQNIDSRMKNLELFLEFLHANYYNILYAWEIFYHTQNTKQFLDWFPRMME